MQILVVGAGGFFGKLLVEELLRFGDDDLILAGRKTQPIEEWRKGFDATWKRRTTVRRLDLLDASAVESAIAAVQIAICAAGPFQGMPHHLLRACLAQRVHYIDLCDDRAFVLRSLEICAHENPAVAIASGWSAVPALSALLADIAAQGLEKIESIRIQIAPGNRAPRSAATVASLLDSVGKPFKLWRRDRWIEVTGWSELMPFEFPEPVGKRFGALVDVPDLQLFPGLFAASTVEFRVGAELMLLNRATSLLAFAAKGGMVKSFRPWAAPMRQMMAVFGFVGHDWGALGVQCTGAAGKREWQRRVSIVADHGGHHIPVMPAVMLCAQLSGGKEINGVLPWRSWIGPEQLRSECERRGYRLVVE
ncbi:MAG TPA: saccharopine dehydrogenase NADP-binding domain-containing protein [Planktothrix sp.]|jgi:hypothetical protein